MPSRYSQKPLSWWLQTPIYAARILRNKLSSNCPSETEVARIVYKEFFASQSQGIMIEVGAARPDFLSLSALFRENRWRVLSVEPNPVFAALHRDRGHEIYEFACGHHDEDGVEFSLVHTHGHEAITNESFSSLSIKPGFAALKDDLDVEKISVNLRRLDTIMADHAPEVESVDCLAIDVEGWELEVLTGFNLARFRPRVCIIENLLDDQTYRDFMESNHYRLWKTFHPNEVYVRAD